MILDTIKQSKRYFDAKLPEDLEVYKNFLINNGWGVAGCPFFLVFPYMNVPEMLQDKIVHNLLGVVNTKSRY